MVRAAAELGVRIVLEGNVRRAGDRVRVTAQLIDGLTGGHVWSDVHDSETRDVFDLQDANHRASQHNRGTGRTPQPPGPDSVGTDDAGLVAAI
ncbi:hypothetical protein QO231_15855 [Sedimentitalea todarodis]|uniref:FlgO domain-containing protein n=1 Tax=Sedimentitalea todarodis TaxID=1631240 RepID=A0ABU3VGJ9_9RHOB|nr:hypothetical protein [Sedimentitalea todarodis]